MRSRYAVLILLASLAAGGCAPRVFYDGATIDIVGAAPPPPVEEVALPETIELDDKVQFAMDSARILKASYPVLDAAAQKILDAPHIRLIRIEGHASADGDDDHNLELSAARAESVLQYLVSQGVDAARLTSEGFGEQRPVADNDTEEGRELNRRVELHIVQQDAPGSDDAVATP